MKDSSQCLMCSLSRVKGKEVIPALRDVPAGDAELSCPGVACWDMEFPGITVIRTQNIDIQGHRMSLASAATSLSLLLFAFPGNPIKFQRGTNRSAQALHPHPVFGVPDGIPPAQIIPVLSATGKQKQKGTQANPEKAIKGKKVWINTLENVVVRDFSCCSSVGDNHNLSLFQMSLDLPFAKREGVINNVDFLIPLPLFLALYNHS